MSAFGSGAFGKRDRDDASPVFPSTAMLPDAASYERAARVVARLTRLWALHRGKEPSDIDVRQVARAVDLCGAKTMSTASGILPANHPSSIATNAAFVEFGLRLPSTPSMTSSYGEALANLIVAGSAPMAHPLRPLHFGESPPELKMAESGAAFITAFVEFNEAKVPAVPKAQTCHDITSQGASLFAPTFSRKPASDPSPKMIERANDLINAIVQTAVQGSVVVKRKTITVQCLELAVRCVLPEHVAGYVWAAAIAAAPTLESISAPPKKTGKKASDATDTDDGLIDRILKCVTHLKTVFSGPITPLIKERGKKKKKDDAGEVKDTDGTKDTDDASKTDAAVAAAENEVRLSTAYLFAFALPPQPPAAAGAGVGAELTDGKSDVKGQSTNVNGDIPAKAKPAALRAFPVEEAERLLVAAGAKCGGVKPVKGVASLFAAVVSVCVADIARRGDQGVITVAADRIREAISLEARANA